ncbi:MAG TPA: type II secretion system F family protein [Gaiellaceae bacterium]|nr:type II secretion system F family protein [Gaiellaceae bacterium]
MTLAFLLGLFLVGLAVALLGRAASLSRTRTAALLEQIPTYGFNRAAAQTERSNVVRMAADAIATRLGGLATGRLADEAALRQKLLAAGLYRMTPRRLTGYRFLAGAGLPVLWLWSASQLGVAPVLLVGGLVLAVVLGWFAPLSIVSRRGRYRFAEIEQELPELIDLLVVTVEAGLGFNGSMQVAAERFRGPLGEELRLTVQEQRMGLSSGEALRNLGARCDTPGVRSFVRAVVQGESLGVSIGQIMRNLAVEMRKRRRQSAEERAQRAPIKILFPLIFMIFPAMFVILLAPAVFTLLDAFRG